MRHLALLLVVAGCVEPTPAPSGTRATDVSSVTLVDDRAVTPEGSRYVAASFSPDGARLAVSAAGYAAIDLVEIAGDGGSTASRLVAGPRSGYRFAWAPDSDSIVYRTADGGLSRAWLDGRRSSLVEAGPQAGFPAFTADGELLYSGRGAVRSFDRAAALPVAHPGLVTVTASAAPRLAGWDGERIFSVDLSTGEEIELFTGAGFFDVELSADGRLAVVPESRGAVGHFWVAATDGSFRRDLGVGYGPRLSPDARDIVYVEQENDGQRFLVADLYLTSIDGGERTRLTDTPEVLEIAPSFSPDGRRIAYVDAATGQVHVATLTEVTR